MADHESSGAVVRRLHRYPGCDTLVVRWFIATDKVPMPYRSQAEALAELARRQAERRRT